IATSARIAALKKSEGRWTPFTFPFNLAHQPAASIPCVFTSAGLPVALHMWLLLLERKDMPEAGPPSQSVRWRRRALRRRRALFLRHAAQRQPPFSKKY